MKRQGTNNIISRAASCFLLIGVFFFLIAPSAQAQDFGRVEETETNADSYFFYVVPGEATIEVQVMGTVRHPGLYRLGQGADLGQLLALSGGPILDVRERDRAREATIRLYRAQAGGEELVYEAGFEASIADRSTSYPELQNGDVMTVEVVERQRITWRDVFTFINSATLIALTIDRFL